jgi:hypothetical protein
MSKMPLRIVAILALATLTATGAAQASGRRFAGGEPSAVTAAWESVAGWFHSVLSLVAPSSDEGSSMDPNGRKTQAGSPAGSAGLNSDEGSSMDPDGRK